jgi:hypothetical protein
MLRHLLVAGEDGRGLGVHRTRWLGILACFSIGCPGVEPSETGTSAGAGGEGGRSSTSNSGSTGQTGSSSTTTGTGMGGNGGAGGCDANPDLGTDINNCGECGRACVDDEQVASVHCKNGVCQSFCESGFVNMTQPETGPDDGCETPGRRAFVTEQAMTVPQIGGVTGADDRCQMIASTLKLGGQWRAWLSDEANASSVAQRFNTQPVAPYMLLDFTPIADSFTQLTTDFGLDHPIDLTENLNTVMGAAAVWTGTTPAGAASGADCNGWNEVDGEVTIGNAAVTTEEWTQQETNGSCGETAQLYCFEQ